MLRLILEGPDNAGKTTFANAIKGNVPYHHPGGPPATFQDEIDCVQQQMDLLLTNPCIIVDRVTPISQQVYSPDRIADRYRQSQLYQYFDIGCVVIYCRPSTDKLMAFENFTWRDGETEAHKQKIIQKQHLFIERYDALMTKIPHVHYDFTDETAAELLRQKCIAAFNGDREAMHFVHAIQKGF